MELKLKCYNNYRPIALKKEKGRGYHKYKLFKFTGYPQRIYCTLPALLQHPRLGVTKELGKITLFHTKFYRFSQYNGVLSSADNNDILALIVYDTKTGELVAFTPSILSIMYTSHKSIRRISNAFINKYGIKKKDIIYKTQDELREMFIKTLKFTLDDASLEEQNKISGQVIRNLLDKYGIKKVEGLEHV